SLSGSDSDSECAKPDWSVSGATTQTSSVGVRAMRSSPASPSAWMPPSLVSRMRTLYLSPHSDVSPADLLQTAHIGPQGLRNGDRPILVLVVLHHRDQRAPDGHARAVERVDELRLLLALDAVARIHAAGLEIAADRAGRD